MKIKSKKISNLLNDMRNKEIIQNVDSRKLSIWRLPRTSVGRALARPTLANPFMHYSKISALKMYIASRFIY